jgi:hypothetical protein
MDIQQAPQNLPNLNTIYEEQYIKDLDILSLYPSNQAVHVHFTPDCKHLAYSSDATDTSGSWLWQSAVQMYQLYQYYLRGTNQENPIHHLIKHVTTTTNGGIKKLMETAKVKEIDDQVLSAVWKRIKAAEVGISTLVTQFKEMGKKVKAHSVEATNMEKECAKVETVYKEWIKNFESMWVEKARQALEKKEKTKVVEYLNQLQKIESLVENVTSITECNALLKIFGESFKENQPPAEQDALKKTIVNESDLRREDQLTVEQGALEINLDDFDDFEIIDGPITKSDLDRIKKNLESDQEAFKETYKQLDVKGGTDVKQYFDRISYHQLVAGQNLYTRHNYNAVVMFLSRDAWSEYDYLGCFHFIKKASTNTSVETIECKEKDAAEMIEKIKEQEKVVYLRLERLKDEIDIKKTRAERLRSLGSKWEDSLEQIDKNLIQEISNEISLRSADGPKKATS